MTETRTRELIEKELADNGAQMEVHHAAIRVLSERGSVLRDELAQLTQGWAIVAECDTAGNLREQPKIHELSGRTKTVGYRDGVSLCLHTVIDGISKLAPLQIFDVRPNDHRWWNKDGIEFGKSTIHTVLSPNGEPLMSFYVSFHRTRDEAEAATRVPGFQPAIT